MQKHKIKTRPTFTTFLTQQIACTKAYLEDMKWSIEAYLDHDSNENGLYIHRVCDGLEVHDDVHKMANELPRPEYRSFGMVGRNHGGQSEITLNRILFTM